MNPDELTPQEQIEARLTALLLGELPALEAEALRADIAKDAELRALHERLRHTIELVRETVSNPMEQTAAPPAPMKLSEAKREKLLAQFKTIEPKEFETPSPRKVSWVLPIAAAAAVIILVTFTMLPNFMRARTSSQSLAIVNNLRQLDGAKQQWAMEQKAAPTAVPTFADLQPYLGRSHGEAPKPVAGEKYVLGAVSESPTAELGGKNAYSWFDSFRPKDTDSDVANKRVTMDANGDLTVLAKNANTDFGDGANDDGVFLYKLAVTTNVTYLDGTRSSATEPGKSGTHFSSINGRESSYFVQQDMGAVIPAAKPTPANNGHSVGVVGFLNLPTLSGEPGGPTTVDGRANGDRRPPPAPPALAPKANIVLPPKEGMPQITLKDVSINGTSSVELREALVAQQEVPDKAGSDLKLAAGKGFGGRKADAFYEGSTRDDVSGLRYLNGNLTTENFANHGTIRGENEKAGSSHVAGTTLGTLEVERLGDPEWVGLLNQTDGRVSGSNQFVSRYAYQIDLNRNGNQDVNFIQNHAAQTVAKNYDADFFGGSLTEKAAVPGQKLAQSDVGFVQNQAMPTVDAELMKRRVEQVPALTPGVMTHRYAFDEPTSAAADAISGKQPQPGAGLPAQLATRTYRVEPGTFEQGLEGVVGIPFGTGVNGNTGGAGNNFGGGGGVGGGGGGGGGNVGGGMRFVTGNSDPVNLNEVAKNFFAASGVDLDQKAGKSVQYDAARGELTVRGTATDLALVEDATKTLRQRLPEVEVKSKFAEVTPDSFVLGGRTESLSDSLRQKDMAVKETDRWAANGSSTPNLGFVMIDGNRVPVAKPGEMPVVAGTYFGAGTDSTTDAEREAWKKAARPESGFVGGVANNFSANFNYLGNGVQGADFDGFYVGNQDLAYGGVKADNGTSTLGDKPVNGVVGGSLLGPRPAQPNSSSSAANSLGFGSISPSSLGGMQNQNYSARGVVSSTRDYPNATVMSRAQTVYDADTGGVVVVTDDKGPKNLGEVYRGQDKSTVTRTQPSFTGPSNTMAANTLVPPGKTDVSIKGALLSANTDFGDVAVDDSAFLYRTDGLARHVITNNFSRNRNFDFVPSGGGGESVIQREVKGIVNASDSFDVRSTPRANAAGAAEVQSMFGLNAEGAGQRMAEAKAAKSAETLSAGKVLTESGRGVETDSLSLVGGVNMTSLNNWATENAGKDTKVAETAAVGGKVFPLKFADPSDVDQLLTQLFDAKTAAAGASVSSSRTASQRIEAGSSMEPMKLAGLIDQLITATNEVVKEEAVLNNLKKLPKEQLRDTLPRVSPDPVLSSLLQDLHTTETQLASLTADLGADHPEVQKARAIKTSLDSAIEDQTKAAMASLQTRLDASKAQASNAQRQLDAAKLNDISISEATQPYWASKGELDRLKRLRDVIYLRISQERMEKNMPKTQMVDTIEMATADGANKPTLTEKISGAFGGEVTRNARIRIQAGAPDRPGLEGDSAKNNSYDPYSVKTEAEAIKSDAVLDRAVAKLKADKTWTEGMGRGLSTNEMREMLKKKLDLEPVRNTSMVDIRAKGEKPVEAAQIANAVAEAYRDYNLEKQGMVLSNAVAAYTRELTEIENQIASREAETAVLRGKLTVVDTDPQRLGEPVLAKKPSVAAPVPQPEVLVRENAFSTFSLNVSDVSFKLAAASLEKGAMPDVAGIRTEEFINAFDYRDPEPPPGANVGFAYERSRYPFAHNRDLLRFSVKTASAGRQAGRPLNLVLLLDNSGSMERSDRVRIIHEALRVLASQLGPQDKVSVVTFARTARLWVDGISGDKAGAVMEQAGGLTPEGGTNLEDAMNLAYATALRHYLANGANRVVLLTDGAANLGDVEPETLKAKVEEHRKQGVALDCFGIGWEGYNDDLLEVLSRNGDGRYGFINSPEEAATGFAQQLAGALQVAASDVKVQVEFNPKRVTTYRQIGYAKHQLKKEQFRDNTVDAAEIGAAESGNALYAIEVNPAGEGPVCTVRVRYKVPGTGDYREQAWTVPCDGNAPALEQSSTAMKLAGTASAFSEWLAQSPFAEEVTPDRLLACMSGVPEVYGVDARPKKLEWMIRQAKSLSGK